MAQFKPNPTVLAKWQRFIDTLKVNGVPLLKGVRGLENTERSITVAATQFFDTFKISTMGFGHTDKTEVRFVTAVIYEQIAGDLETTVQTAEIVATAPLGAESPGGITFDRGGEQQAKGQFGPVVKWSYDFATDKLEIESW